MTDQTAQAADRGRTPRERRREEEHVSAKDYTDMWTSLGINLDAHTALLNVLGQAYDEVYLSQKNRPKGMEYLDFVMSEIHGLRIEELVQARNEGRKVIGTFCLYVPEEIILAADGICVGLCAGADMGSELAEQVLPRNTCALIKSFVGFKLAGVCPYVESCDLVIGETTCDGKTKAYEIFNEYKPTFVIEVPHMKTAAGRALWRSELDRLTIKIEQVTGRAITPEKLARATETVNAKRAALHRLNALRRANPAPISGRDALLVNQVAFYDDPVRFTAKVNELCDELEERVVRGEGVAPAHAPRILLSGCPMSAPNWKVPYIIESSGAVIVGEESCVGERGTRNLVDLSGLPAGDRAPLLDRIAERYMKIDCAVFTPNQERTDHVLEMSRGYQADGVVHYSIQFCTPYAMEAGSVQKAMQGSGIPFLRLETDYSMEDAPQLQTRVQAFLELLK
jgi:benzoyl-CoA reductase/2-hydroxyglutaryl-CoA dehydratase subunit BcrC/BadD/HgdB